MQKNDYNSKPSVKCTLDGMKEVVMSSVLFLLSLAPLIRRTLSERSRHDRAANVTDDRTTRTCRISPDISKALGNSFG